MHYWIHDPINDPINAIIIRQQILDPIGSFDTFWEWILDPIGSLMELMVSDL